MLWQEARLPWSYEQKVKDFMKPGVRRLDIGRGQGISDCETGCFDLVTAYQTGYDLGEVARALKKGGFFVTQQVGGRNRPDMPAYNLENEGPKLEAAGFRMMYSHQGYYTGEDGILQHRFIMIGKLINKGE